MLISLTVGKVDAGVAVLLTDDKRLIEFPSILLPPSITSGSIVDITVSRNPSLEASNASAFSSLQSSILSTYGLNSPSPPQLRLRNATQTSVVLEWDPLNLATSTLRSLALFRNNAKAGLIPRVSRDGAPVHATKVSGLAVDTEYTFHLLLRTSAGTYTSNRLVVKTQKMTDLTGITVTPGPLPPALRASVETAVERIGAKLVEGVRIETTHFVCTEGRGREWERAVEMNIPVVRPEWVEGCEREGRIVGVRAYYLGADPKLRQVGQGVGMGGGGRRGDMSPATPAQTPSLAQGSQHSLPIREQQQQPERGGQATTPVTPWPPNLSQRPPESESSGEEPGDEQGPSVPAKDRPEPEAVAKAEAEERQSKAEAAKRYLSAHTDDDPASLTAGDIGGKEKEEDSNISPATSEKGAEEAEEEASGTVSPEEEGPGGSVKPTLPRGESQGNFSEVDL